MRDVTMERTTLAENLDGESPVEKGRERPIDVLGMARTLYSKRKTVLLTTGISFALACVLAVLLPAHYTSEVSFIPPTMSNSNSMAAVLAGQLGSLAGGDLLGGGKNSGELYSGILRSRGVAGEIVKRFDLIRLFGVKKESQAEKVLMAGTTVTIDPKSSIVTVSVTEKSPGLAHDIAVAYMDALRGTEGRLALTESSQKRLFFGQQLTKEKDALADAEVDLKKTEEHSGLIAPTGQTESQIRTLAATQAAIASRQVELAALRQSSTEENPQVIRLRTEIGDLERQLNGMQSGSGRGTGTVIPTSKVPEAQLEYIRKAREVKYHETLFEMLSRQYESARLDEAREAPVLQVIDPPSYPDMRSGPKRLYIMLGGLLFGAVAGSLWVLTKDGFRKLITSLSSPGQN